MNFKNISEEKKALIAYVLVCILWGSTYLAIRIGVDAMPPMVFAGMRFLIAGALMVGYAALKGLAIPKKPRDIFKISAVGLFLLLGGNGCVVLAETWVSSGMASLLISTVPLFMVLIELVSRINTRVSLKAFLGLLVGFGGVAALVYTNSDMGSLDAKGAVVLLFGAFSWACGSVFSKTFKAEGSIVPQIGIQMLAGGAGLFITGGLLGEIPRIHFTSSGLLALAYLIVFGSIIGYSCYIYLLKKWTAAKAGTYAYVNPVVAVLLGVLVLNEPVSFYIVIAALIILSGVVLVQTSKE